MSIFLGVSLRFARVGVLRATLSLRCYASLRTVLTHALRMPHAKNAATKQIPPNPSLIL
ncbi:MAG: hypothetical protein NZ455_14825 [Bacteroidia bacterium]|nr:hypothetical protein [Bacteroidia bacterium]